MVVDSTAYRNGVDTNRSSRFVPRKARNGEDYPSVGREVYCSRKGVVGTISREQVVDDMRTKPDRVSGRHWARERGTG